MRSTGIILLIGGLGICLFALFMNKSEKESAINHFHEQYNNGEFDSIWNEAQPKFRDSLTKDEYINHMHDVQNKFGKVVSSSQLSKREVNRFSWTRKIEIVQRTVFEKGESVETFRFEFINQKALLIHYSIKSEG